ncbi:phosphatase PAP2 family protein [Candidatus Saccharibacteria bacterium]|nr:phosphatase PAP2 family protein [Candidatus Saccharibacteria bacterium]
MDWNKITNIILVIAFLVLLIFVILGLYQWISRKSLKKVDKPLLFMPIPLALMAIVYFVFDKLIVVNTRPNGSGEPSFPSTHTMVTATIFFCVAVILPKYVKNKIFLTVIYLLMLVLIAGVSVGRVLANMHWVTDVVAGLLFALGFAGIYWLILRKFSALKK